MGAPWVLQNTLHGLPTRMGFSSWMDFAGNNRRRYRALQCLILGYPTTISDSRLLVETLRSSVTALDLKPTCASMLMGTKFDGSGATTTRTLLFMWATEGPQVRHLA